jgi:DNA-binding CsgD family transcriptional regulator
MALAIESNQEHNFDEVQLTKREAEILCLIAQGHGSHVAADFLFVSKRTVDYHLTNAYKKLKVGNRLQAIHAAERLGLIRGEAVFGIFQKFREAVEPSDTSRSPSDRGASIERTTGNALQASWNGKQAMGE